MEQFIIVNLKQKIKQIMAKLRYKNGGEPFEAGMFNVHAIGEVLTEDDSVFVSELDAFINGGWKDLKQAFKDKDLITDNYNLYFFEPENEEDRERGYTLW